MYPSVFCLLVHWQNPKLPQSNRMVCKLFLCLFIAHAFSRFDAHIPLFETQFSAPVPQSKNIVQDGACDFFNYSTGRRGLLSLHTTISLLPRHDALLSIYNFLWTLIDFTYTPRDEIQLDFTLHPNVPTLPFVWGIIKKEEMAEMRRNRWDLVCFITVAS